MKIMLGTVMETIVLCYIYFYYIILPVLIIKNIMTSRNVYIDIDNNDETDETEQDQSCGEEDSGKDSCDLLVRQDIEYIPRKFRTKRIRKILKDEQEITKAIDILTTSVMIYGGGLAGYLVFKNFS